MSDWRVPLSVPSVRGNEGAYVAEAISRNEIAVGEAVPRFENEFAEYLGVRNAVAVSNGTAAIHLALLALGIGPGDEVLVPDFTFVATVNPVVYTGSTVVFVDAEPQGWGLDPRLVEDELRRRAKHGIPQPALVIVAHVYGLTANVHRLVEVCNEFEVSVVEDAAESLGATLTMGSTVRGVGLSGQIGCFSFNGNKLITTGGGGMIVTDDDRLALDVRHLATQARIGHPAYIHDRVAYNYRMPNLNAAFGLGQLEQLPSLMADRRRVAERYRTAFEGIDGVEFMPAPPWGSPSAWMSCILLRDARKARSVASALAEAKVETRPVWQSLRTMTPFRGAATLGGGLSDDLGRRGLCLPSSADLASATQDEVIGTVLDAVRR